MFNVSLPPNLKALFLSTPSLICRSFFQLAIHTTASLSRSIRSPENFRVSSTVRVTISIKYSCNYFSRAIRSLNIDSSLFASSSTSMQKMWLHFTQPTDPSFHNAITQIKKKKESRFSTANCRTFCAQIGKTYNFLMQSA